jgi:hypothetical protein
MLGWFLEAILNRHRSPWAWVWHDSQEIIKGWLQGRRCEVKMVNCLILHWGLFSGVLLTVSVRLKLSIQHKVNKWTNVGNKQYNFLQIREIKGNSPSLHLHKKSCYLGQRLNLGFNIRIWNLWRSDKSPQNFLCLDTVSISL